MPFQYTFRADDISTWDVDTRDLVENRDRELELYASTIDSSFLNLNADNLISGTVPSSRVTGAYTGITQVGTLSAGVASYSIGDTGPSGGKVFITPSTSGNTTGLYFEVAPVSAQVQRYWAQFTPVWYNSTSVPLAQFDTIGTGKTNTVAIVNQGNNDPTVSAAKYCDDYTYGGFSDWFLPSRDELTQIYTNRVALGNDFGIGYFWSSSEEVYDGAWVRFFTNGADTTLAKGNNVYVRPVRSFSTIGLNVRGSAVVRTAATQDGVILTGRAGGTSDYAVSILPTTLNASRTVTLPDVSGTAITTGNLSDITSVGALGTLNVSALNVSGISSFGSEILATTSIAAGRGVGIKADPTNAQSILQFTNNAVSVQWASIVATSSAFTITTNLTIDGPGSPAITLGDAVFAGYSGVVGDKGYLLVGNSVSDPVMYLRTSGAGGVYLGASNSNTLQVGNGSASIFGGSGTTITATTQTLINGTNNNAGIYLGGGTASTATGGIEASWRGAANPSIAIGVTRDNNGTKTVWEYSNTIDSFTANTLRTRVNSNGFTITGTGSLYLSGSTNSALTFANTPDTALPWMQGPVLQGQTGWAFYSVVNSSYRMGFRSGSSGATRYMWCADNTLLGSAPNDGEITTTLNVIGNMRTTAGYYGTVTYGSYGSLSMYGENGGYVGITFPGHSTTWMSATNGQIFGIYRNNTTWNFYVSNGTFVPSDARYKRDIEPLQHGMNLIREIVPVTYDPLTEDPSDDPEQTVGRTHYGFTTQNILQALTNAGETRDIAIVDIGGPANESNESDRQYLNHSALIAPMIKAIQELDTRLQQLETV